MSGDPKRVEVDLPEPEVTEAQALLNVIRILGPVKILFRGSTEQARKSAQMNHQREVRKWLKETATWIKTPPRW